MYKIPWSLSLFKLANPWQTIYRYLGIFGPLLGLFLTHVTLICLLNLSFVVKLEPNSPSRMISRVFMAGETPRKIVVKWQLYRLPLYMLESACYVYGKYSRDRKYLIPWIVQILYGFFAHQIKFLLTLLRDDVQRLNSLTAGFTVLAASLAGCLLLQEYRTLRATLNARFRITRRFPLYVDAKKIEKCMEQMVERKSKPKIKC